MTSDSHIEKPICLSLLACETVLHNPNNQNKSYIEAFHAIMAAAAPAIASRFILVASLTNVVGNVEFGVRITDPANKTIFEAKTSFKDADPLHVIDINFSLNGLQLDHFGTYHIDLLSGTEHIASRRFHLNKFG